MLQVFSTQVLVNQLRQYYDAGPGVVQSQSGVGPAALYEDFLSGQGLDPRITFSRTSNATLTGSNGLIQYAPHNLLTYSEQFDNAAWTKLGSTISANVTAAPNGTVTADKLVETADLNPHRVSASVNVSAGITYSTSVYAKADTRNFLQLFFGTAQFGTNAYANFDLATGTIGDIGSSATAAMSAVGDGWYRCSITAPATTTGLLVAGQLFQIVTSSTSARNENYTGDGVSGLYLWGAQFNVDGLQSYNPTTVKNLLGYTQEFDNAAWTKSNSFIQTNLLTYSQEFDNAAWTKGNTTISADTAVAPDGTTTADKLVENTANSTHVILSASQSFSAGIAYTFSVYLKAGERYRGLITLATGAVAFGGSVSANFDLQAGTITALAGSPTLSITSVGSDWYRLTISKTAIGTATESGTGVRLANDAGATTYTGDGVSGFYLWGAQFVQGTSAGDYQTTYGAAAAVQYTAPDGSLSADQVMFSAGTVSKYVAQTVTPLSTVHTFNVYAKTATQQFIQILNSGAAAFYANFDISTGVVGNTGASTTASITSVGNGWYRLSVTFTGAALGTGWRIYASDSLLNGYAPTTSSANEFYLWGAQLSDSASVDPYVYNPVAAPTAAAYYGPRFDYDPVTLAPKGLLIEEQRTNLLTYSQEFDNAAWVKTNASISANVLVCPDGTLTADKLVEDTAVGTTHRAYQSRTCAASTTYSCSVYAKAGERTRINLIETTLGGSIFDLSTGTVVLTTGGTAAIAPAGNDWYRCSIVVTTGGAQTAFVSQVQLVSGTSNSYTGDGVSGAYIWGAQLEAGTFATSYIPTVASQVTRAADTALMQGANFSNWYNQNNGTFVFQGEVKALVAGARFLGVSDGTLTNRMELLNNLADGKLRWFSSGGVASDTANSMSANTVFRASGAYKLDDYATALNGGSIVADTTATVPVVNQMRIGYSTTTGSLNGWVSKVAYYNRRLANSELQGLTS